MANPDDLQAGHYVATATVHSNRRNLFLMERGKERHIVTLVGGSASKLALFDADCARIVNALAFYEASKAMLADMSDREDRA